MKKYILTIVISLIGATSVLSAGHEHPKRILLLNECVEYNSDLNMFVPLIKSWNKSMSAAPRSMTSISDISPLQRTAYTPIEWYFHQKGDYTTLVTSIKNQQSAFSVLYETGKQLKEMYETVIIVMQPELEALYKVYKSSNKTGSKDGFRSFISQRYNIDTLLILTESNFDMQLDSKIIQKRPKIVTGTVELACNNQWEWFCASKNSVLKPFETKGSSEMAWNNIPKKEAREKYMLAISQHNIESIDSYLTDINVKRASPYDLLPVINQAAEQAAKQITAP